jgi:hypothetical protein
MQLQIECNSSCEEQQLCWVCELPFKLKEARIIICDNQGTKYGDVCPDCLGKGFNWLSDRFERLAPSQYTKPYAWIDKLNTLVDA